MNSFKKTLAFNTGRQYSAAGQRIAAGLLDDGDILFVDIDRGLEYLIPASVSNFTQAAIMAAYDGGAVEWLDNNSWEPVLAQELSAIAAEVK
jgi:hypothetical protein